MHYPPVLRNNIQAFEQHKPWVSVDFEFPPDHPENPTIVGLSSGGVPVSSFYDDGCREELARLERAEVQWLGHNSLTTEREILETELGVKIPLARMDDSMLKHYLCNAELCKGAAKDEDEEDPRGQGFMDLWTMASLYTELPQWKECRGVKCEGPCRHHDVLGYNGTDAYSVDDANPRLNEEMRAKKIPDNLYQNLKKLVVLCDAMTRNGIKVDRKLVHKLETEFEERKANIFPHRWVHPIGKRGQQLKRQVIEWDAPFNPRSPKQVLQWFRDHGVGLGSTEKEEIQHAAERFPEGTDPEVREWLGKLFDYKDEGKGLKPWFNERYFGTDGLLHPRFIVPGTSMGRLASSSPNFQNIPRVGFGKKVRAVVIPRDSSLILAKADKSQLELRMCLWYSGVTDPLPGDAFNWLVEQGQGVFEKAGEITNKSPRDTAKSVSHGGDYLEGVKVYYGKDLASARTKKAIDYGALIIHRDWEYHGGVVGFTGVNLAERLFGSATFENRKKALEIQEAYFKRFVQIRQWHKSISLQAERGYVQSASGRYLQLLGTPEDKLKMAAAFYGQGGGADDVIDAMNRYGDLGHVPLLQCHDELAHEFDRSVTDAQLLQFFSIMSMPSTSIPGFQCPVKVSRGENWKDMTEIGTV